MGVLTSVAASAPARSTAFQAALRDQPALANGIVAAINRVRAAHGLSRVTWFSGLAAAARQHSDEMASLGYFSHMAHDGQPLEKRLEHFFPATNYSFWSVGEALLWSSPTISPASAVRAWLRSSEHRRVLLNPLWRQVGISAVHDASAPGVYESQEVTVVTADFGTRTG